MVSVIAHRGASRVERENTVAAFVRAAAMGAHAVELDVRRTRDGVLVVHHDPRFDDGRSIVELDHADLPEHVPTLHRALDACRPLWVNVEIKNDPSEPDFDPSDSIADETIEVLARRDEPVGNWLVSSFRRETVDRCHAVAPSIRTAWLTVDVPVAGAAALLDDLVESGHSALHPWVGALTRSLVDACHARGLEVNTWTCDDPERMSELVSWGIDGICTNVPDLALTRL